MAPWKHQAVILVLLFSLACPVCPFMSPLLPQLWTPLGNKGCAAAGWGRGATAGAAGGPCWRIGGGAKGLGLSRMLCAANFGGGGEGKQDLASNLGKLTIVSAERAGGLPSMGHVATADGEREREGEGEGEGEGRRGGSYSRDQAPRGGATADDNKAADEAVKAAKKAAASEAASKIAAARWAERWESMYEKLLRQREKEGDEWLGVVRESQDKELHRWIKTQRTMYRTDKLRPERKERLEAAGIAFGDPAYKQGSKRKSESITNEKKFELMLFALAQYKAENGDCGVPRTWKENPKLGLWVQRQRTKKKKGDLSENRINRLEELGFLWDGARQAVSWDDSFRELADFKDEHGHCNVPQRGSKLGVWLHQQRQMARRGVLSRQRARALDDLGVAWDLRRSWWQWQGPDFDKLPPG